MLRKYLTSGFEFTQDEQDIELKYKLFNSLLFLNISVVFVAGLFRLINNEITHFFIDMTYSFLGTLTIYFARKKRSYFPILVKFVMIFSYFIVAASFSLEPNSVAGISWFIILLMVTIFLTDRKFVLFILVLSILSILALTFTHKEQGYTLFSAIYGLIPMLLAFAFIYFDETRNIQNQQQLKEFNEELQKLVAIEVQKNKEQEELIAKQAQSAAMGEMIDAIAHQWKQPLGVIQMNMQSLSLQLELGMQLDANEFKKLEHNVSEQVVHLIETVDEFRSFFRPTKNFKVITVNELIESTKRLMKDTLINNNITIESMGNKEIEILCAPNEFKHIFINLINNAKDEFISKEIKPRQIVFEVSENESEIFIEIKDNAGGVPNTIIDKLFEAHISTKVHTEQGTGIGLYLSKQIVEKHHGNISVHNIQDGACFTITLPKSQDSTNIS